MTAVAGTPTIVAVSTGLRRGMVVLVLAVVVVFAQAVVSAGVTGRGAQTCSRRAASDALLSANLGERGRVAQVLCGDFTRDGRIDMAVSAATAGSAGVIGWAIFTAVPGGWKLALNRPNAYRPRLIRLGGDVLEIVPLFRRGDPNCCPSGGSRDTIFRWNGRRFVAAFSWKQRP